jgi:hypothetical protein
MDRDPAENVVDAEDRTTPTTGNSDYGEVGAKRARKAADEEPDRSDQTADGPTVIPPPD